MLKIEVIGNLGADAEVQNSNGSKFVTFRIAHTERWTDNDGHEKEETRWIDCVWNNTESKLLAYLKAGVKVFVRGHLRARVFSSMKYRRMEVGISCIVQEIELCGGSAEAVPRQVVDMRDGTIYDVSKYYWVNAPTKGMKSTDKRDFTDNRGRLFSMDFHGFVTPVTDNAQAADGASETKVDSAQSTAEESTNNGQQ